jgi:hypothetical protein
MAQLPRTDIQFQTGIWWPYQKGLQNGSWHPVRELYTVHDSFVPDRSMIGPVHLEPGKLARVASPATEGLAGWFPKSAIAATRYRTALMDRAAGTADPSVEHPRHAHVHVQKPVVARRKLRKAVRRKRGFVARIQTTARPVTPSAIRNVKRTLPSIQRPVPENVRIASKRATGRVMAPAVMGKGWFSKFKANARASQTLNGCPCS